MRIERWYWLILFCVISLGIHIGLALKTPGLGGGFPSTPATPQIEVALEPLPVPEPKKPEPKQPEPKQKPKLEEKRDPKQTDQKPVPAPRKSALQTAPVRIVRADKPIRIAKADHSVLEKRPAAANANPGGNPELEKEKPITSGLPSGQRDAGVPRPRIKMDTPGGGSPAPDPSHTGHDGLKGADAPPDDVIFTGGGAGGEKLPKAPPAIGGGGGNSILSVQNPLAKTLIPEEKPGVGPGKGGNEGKGIGGGLGNGRSKGIGTRLDGVNPLASLRRKPGSGIGAGEGDKTGTFQPRGGRGTGGDLPGTGGEGNGYGHKSGDSIGDGDGSPVGRRKGVPYGDVTGLLRGDPNGGKGNGGGPGGTGRGNLFGIAPTVSRVRGGKIHLVFVLDSSGSMRDGHKIDKAKEELKNYIMRELRAGDTFDIINFDHDVRVWSPTMLPANNINRVNALTYVDGIALHDYTNLSGALEAAFAIPEVTHLFVLSDGEPNIGVSNFDQLEAWTQEHNTKHIQINTLALGLGEHFKGMELLSKIAEQNGGQYRYVNMRNIH